MMVDEMMMDEMVDEMGDGGEMVDDDR